MRIIYCSQFINDNGHYRNYADAFNSHLSNYYEIVTHFPPQHWKFYSYIPKIVRNSNYKIVSRLVRVFNSIEFYHGFKKTVKRTDCCFFADYEYLSLFMFLKFFLGKNVKKVIWIHSASTSGNLLYRYYKKLCFLILRSLLNDTTRIVVNGEFVRDELCKIIGQNFESKITVIQYPCELYVTKSTKLQARRVLGIGMDQTVLLMAGIIRKDKSYFKIFASLGKVKCSNVVLLVAGANFNEDIDLLRRESQGLVGVSTHFVIRYLSEEELDVFFAAADVLLMSYSMHNVSQSGPLSLAREYLLPVVSTNVGEIGSYIENNGLGYLSGDNEEFPKLIQKSIDHVQKGAEERCKIIENLKSARSKYSWASAALKYKNTFEKL